MPVAITRRKLRQWSARSSSGIMRSRVCPIAWPALWPKMCSAVSFQSRMMPSRSAETIACGPGASAACAMACLLADNTATSPVAPFACALGNSPGTGHDAPHPGQTLELDAVGELFGSLEVALVDCWYDLGVARRRELIPDCLEIGRHFGIGPRHAGECRIDLGA